LPPSPCPASTRRQITPAYVVEFAGGAFVVLKEELEPAGTDG
jgi:hypothetical protein